MSDESDNEGFRVVEGGEPVDDDVAPGRSVFGDDDVSFEDDDAAVPHWSEPADDSYYNQRGEDGLYPVKYLGENAALPPEDRPYLEQTDARSLTFGVLLDSANRPRPHSRNVLFAAPR